MNIVYLSGGVGGARLLVGLDRVSAPNAVTAIVNTADDFEHWGLQVCPDLDTVMYNLAGLSNRERGWGLAQESHAAASKMAQLGGEDWFLLSDQDLPTHLRRTELLRQGLTLTQVTAHLCEKLGVSRGVLPMTNQPVRTLIECADGRALPFQHWFVKERHAPAVSRVMQAGVFEDSPEVLSAIADADAVLIGPSNPYVSIDPILGGRKTLASITSKPCFAVSPLVHGQAVKGPLATMVQSLAARPPDAAAIADHYRVRFGRPLRGIVVEHGDRFDPTAGPGGQPPLAIHETRTVMKTEADQIQLAQDTVDFIARELDP